MSRDAQCHRTARFLCVDSAAYTTSPASVVTHFHTSLRPTYDTLHTNSKMKSDDPPQSYISSTAISDDCQLVTQCYMAPETGDHALGLRFWRRWCTQKNEAPVQIFKFLPIDVQLFTLKFYNNITKTGSKFIISILQISRYVY